MLDAQTLSDRVEIDAALITQNAANSANGQLIISFTVDGGPVQQVSTAANAAPPIQGGSCNSFSAGEKTCIASQL